MFGRNVDFFAVFIITLGLLACSKASTLRLPEPNSLRLENAVNLPSCPMGSRILSQVASVLNR